MILLILIYYFKIIEKVVETGSTVMSCVYVELLRIKDAFVKGNSKL